jgi:soluble lytic murein transglycosylase-like protein
MVATIMQIESCGDPRALSVAGAQGLFQVMPFHFTAGEDMLDPNTNARRGMNYFAERLVQTAGDVGKAFAGYNGGHVAAGSSWDNWADETQRYYVWSTGIYEDAKAGLTESPTLQEWYAAGGASLCQQAATRLNLR